MTPLPPNDPMIALWQSASTPDTRLLLQDLQRTNGMHQRLNRTLFAILTGISLLLIFEEATGRIATHGTLPVIWILGLVIGLVRRRRARCNRLDALALDTVSLLKFMIARTKKDLFIARCLYAGVPCGAVVAFFAVKFAGFSGSPSTIDMHAHLHWIQTGAAFGALAAMILAGVVLERSRRAQVQELSEKLKLIESDV
jgi:hypothetical protein